MFLPKTFSPGFETYAKVYEPGNMRPLSIVGCFNRILANAFQAKLSGLVQNLIDDHQRGFLQNRLITQNIGNRHGNETHLYDRGEWGHYTV